jgi:methenyltetrahydromethanopterin cyclohydrolase
LKKLLTNPDIYRVKVEQTELGTTVVDAGIEAEGGFQAGILITEICMGGCAKAEITHDNYGGLRLPAIQIYTDQPVIATLGSQYAGWQINEKDYFAIGSGPARALAQKPSEVYTEIGYKDDSDKAIVVLETQKRPPANLEETLAEDCKVSPEQLFIVLTPTTSLAGAVQVSGRIVETGIHKLRRLGLQANAIQSAWGCAPIPPVHPKFAEAMGRTNDAILYGGACYYVVNYGDEEKLEEMVGKAPSMASKAYGKPFSQIFKEAGYDFYKIDPNLFAPAMIAITNMKTGHTFASGEINVSVLAESFGLGRV